MSLEKARIGEIAMLLLLKKSEEEGISLKPKEIRREIMNGARKLGISNYESAQFAKIVIKSVYDKTMDALDGITPSTVFEKE